MRRCGFAVLTVFLAGCVQGELFECLSNRVCGPCERCVNGACQRQERCDLQDAGAQDLGGAPDLGVEDLGVVDSGAVTPKLSGGVGGQALAGALTVFVIDQITQRPVPSVDVQVLAGGAQLRGRTSGEGRVDFENPALRGAVDVHAFPRAGYRARSMLGVGGSAVTLGVETNGPIPAQPIDVRGAVNNLVSIGAPAPAQVRVVSIVPMRVRPFGFGGFWSELREDGSSRTFIYQGGGYEHAQYRFEMHAFDFAGVVCLGGLASIGVDGLPIAPTYTRMGMSVARASAGERVRLDCTLEHSLLTSVGPRLDAQPEGTLCCETRSAIELSGGFAEVEGGRLPALLGALQSARYAFRITAKSLSGDRRLVVNDLQRVTTDHAVPGPHLPWAQRVELRDRSLTVEREASDLSLIRLCPSRGCAWDVLALSRGPMILPTPPAHFQDPLEGASLRVVVELMKIEGFDAQDFSEFEQTSSERAVRTFMLAR